MSLKNKIKHPRKKAGMTGIGVSISIAMVVLLVTGYFCWTGWRGEGGRTALLLDFLRNPQSHPEWMMQAGERCGDAPFVFPADGYVGYLWGDSFRPLHVHSGIDIFGDQPIGQSPVVAATYGYLTRLPNWKSAVIIRVPVDPLQPGREIWLYYTHMADAVGNSFIVDAFPAGTREKTIHAGELIGYQGNYTGDPANPAGIHLHFSIVRGDGNGGWLNEVDIDNTLDPSPYLGLSLNASNAEKGIPVCRP